MAFNINIFVRGHELSTDYEGPLAVGSNKFDVLNFTFEDDCFEGYTMYAIVYQNLSEIAKVPLESDNTAEIPMISTRGKVYIGLRGEAEDDYIGTTNMVVFNAPNGAVDGEVALTPSQYAALIKRLETLEGTGSFEDLKNKLLADLTDTIQQMKQEIEQEISASADSVSNNLKQDVIATAEEKIEELTIETSKQQTQMMSDLQKKIDAELQRLQDEGDQILESLKAFDTQDLSSFMRISTYDPQKRGATAGYGDIYDYAANIATRQAQLIQANVEALKIPIGKNADDIKTVADEVTAAHKFKSGGVTYTYESLYDALTGICTLMRNYTSAQLQDYNAFTVEIVERINFSEPGEERKFYLVPNTSGTGYDKYWYVTDTATGRQYWDSFGSANSFIVDELPEVGDSNSDYILNSGYGYVYYKYIDGNWELIAGSMAEVVEALPETGSELTDYYVPNESGAYVHYRWIGGKFVSVGSDSYTKEEIDDLLNKVHSSNTNLQSALERLASAERNLSATSQALSKLQQTIQDLDTEGNTYDVDYDTATGLFTLYENEEVKRTFTIQGGGGGGGTPATSLKVDKITPSPLILTTTDIAELEIDYSSQDSDGSDVDGTYVLKMGSSNVMSGNLVQGRNKFDVTELIAVGTQKFTLTVTDEGGSVSVKTWTVQMVDVRLESSASDRYTTAVGRDFMFTFTPYGSIAKTVHFKLDGEEIHTISTSASGTLHSYSVPAQVHGAHLLEVWITATVNNSEIETDHIFKDIIWYDENSDVPVIGCIFRNDHYGNVTAKQYDTTPITYHVFDPNTATPTVVLAVDGRTVSTNTLTQSNNIWNYQSEVIGQHTLTITCRDTVVTIVFNITELGIDVGQITGGLEIDFNPSGITNASADRLWSNEKYHMSVSDNFDWNNGGYQIDADGSSYFLIKAGTRATFDYLMFSGGLDANPSVLGAEMKVIFMTENVQDANAVWFNNVETTSTEIEGVTTTTNMGIQLSVHEGWLKTNSASDTDVETGEGESAETVAATNTYLYMPYSEEDIIEMDINIDILNREDSTAQAFVMGYEDGVPAKAFCYGASDRFYQFNPKPIVIGSDYCDVRIYRFKIYSTSLTTEGIMRNFIADSRESTTMLSRYNRNSIYYNRETNEYTPYSGEGVLDPERLAKVIPNVKVLMLETDHFTTSKKTFVKSSWRCIHAPGGDLYPGDEYWDNWLCEYGWHSGQGTTSDNYGNAGRNVDFLFNCDGVHKPSDKVKDPESDYISQVTFGYNTERAYTEKCTDWKGDSGKLALTRTSVPNNFFNLKVNIASSENVNNALQQKRYNDFLPYISPGKRRDSKVKNSMEFVPAVLFLKETNPDTSAHNEFMDCEWHFYALGNIGDSKKTDYTRAYDPKDMNEFTIEISDNTKNNATFQSGIYIAADGSRQKERFRVEESVDDGETIYTPVSLDKPDKFVYPVTLEEWEDEENMRYWALYNEGFDGDHSFEPRYACCGDYRDGKLVNDTTGKGKAQVSKNNDVWRAFYRWVITATDEQFKDELDQWAVRSAVEFFYAFTHYYTMMDNRAKNTFWHFAKTGTYREASRPVRELLHVYHEKTTKIVDDVEVEEYVPTTDVEINPEKTYYTQYAFDLWDYDNDTALGINNNGELIFPYGKEDHDYNIEGKPSSGYVFNGATSVFFCRLRDLLPGEITSTFNSVAAECFSANNLIKQYDDFQNCYPEEIWRLDIQRKYIRTFTGESVDNSKPKHDVQYLRDMMQGRKKYQRRQWVRDQEIYFGTKNLMNTVVGDHNRIIFRCFTPTGDDVVVKPDYTLRITPYSDMYLSVMFGNGGTQQIRAKGGTEYEITCPLSAMDDTQVTIYGANRIAALSDLSACYIAANNFSMASKLRKLVIGNTTPGYANEKLTGLTLGSNRLLEELDIRNCGNLTGAINLAQCNNLLRLLASGTKLTGVTFATNGKVREVQLPDTITTLIMRNLLDLQPENFTCALNRLETLTMQGGNLDTRAIVENALNTLQVLTLLDIDWDVSDTTLLNRILNLFYSQLTGEAYISGSSRQRELDAYAAAWPDLEVTYDPLSFINQYPVYVYDDDKQTLLDTIWVDQAGLIPAELLPSPTKASDAQYHYTFDRWMFDAEAEVNLEEYRVTSSVRIYAKYSTEIRRYTVRWYLYGTNLLQEKTVNYGEAAEYEGSNPVRTDGESAYIYYLFRGWDKFTGYITGDMNVYADWEIANGLPTPGTDMSEMTPAQIYAIVRADKVNDYFVEQDHFSFRMGHDVQFSNIESRELARELYFDGKTAIDTGVQLFNEDKPWTLAFEFTYDSDYASYPNGTLLSAYDMSSYDGLEVYYNQQPRLIWGITSAQVGYQNYRNLVVIRHEKGAKHIQTFMFDNTNSNLYSKNHAISMIDKTRATICDATLVLGARKDSYSGEYTNYGKGTVNWCKVWFADLGATTCTQMVKWTHEEVIMEYYGDNGGYRYAGAGYAKMAFISRGLLDKYARMRTTNVNEGGFPATDEMHAVLNRYYEGLPNTLKSIIRPITCFSTAGNKSTDLVSSTEYIYLPSYVEMSGATNEPYIYEAKGRIPWFSSDIYRAKFRGKIVPYTAKYYTDSSDPSLIYNVQDGDVWKVNGNGECRIYAKGAWITAATWWERSPIVSNTAHFYIVNTNGNPHTNYYASSAYGVCPCFSF